VIRYLLARTQRYLELRNLRGRIVGTPGLAVTLALALVFALLVLSLLSDRPAAAIFYYFLGPFLTPFSLGNMLSNMTPLILTSLGMVLAFRASVYNLGGEGQVYSGALCSAAVLLLLPRLPGFLGIVLGLLAAALVSASLAFLSGWLRVKWEVSELISSFLLSAAVILMVDYLITGPLDDPHSNLLSTGLLNARYWLPRLFPPSHLNIGLILAVGAAIITAFFLFRTRAGYELRIVGLNREFARYGGIRTSTYVLLSMALSGALHGLAGATSILGVYHAAIKGFSTGLGWNGIAVALIGRTHPIGILPAALLYAYLEAGAKAAMIHAGVSLEIATLVQAFIFYLITAQRLLDFLRHRQREAS
jgi:simple sugar transport system permease protein